MISATSGRHEKETAPPRQNKMVLYTWNTSILQSHRFEKWRTYHALCPMHFRKYSSSFDFYIKTAVRLRYAALTVATTVFISVWMTGVFALLIFITSGQLGPKSLKGIKKPITMRETHDYRLCVTTSYHTCVLASGSVIIEIFNCFTQMRVSCLHLGQNRGKFSSTVSSRNFTRALLWHTGHNIHFTCDIFNHSFTNSSLFHLWFPNTHSVPFQPAHLSIAEIPQHCCMLYPDSLDNVLCTPLL